MAIRKGIHISGNYAAPHIYYMPCSCMCTLYLKNSKGRTKSYFTLFLKLNDHPTRSFNFGFPNGSMFELNFLKFKSKTNPF